MKKHFVLPIAITLSLLQTQTFATQNVSKATTAEKQQKLEPKQALDKLRDGNKRFINNKLRQYNFQKEMKVTSTKGQHPLAIILNCVDSRSIPDILFDQGLGNIFVARIAGNVATPELIGSMEFTTKVAGAPLIVVMGHTHCGAVQGACASGGQTGLKNLDKLLSHIEPAVKTLAKTEQKQNCSSYDYVDKIAKQNVMDQMKMIPQTSEVIANLKKDNQIMIVGAMHDISTGDVYFFDENGQKL